jgi:hypothetical protein
MTGFGRVPDVLLIALLSAAGLSADGFRFVHPGLLHSRADFERMKDGVARKREPIFAGYQVFRAHAQSQAAYRMQGPFEEIGRNPNVHFREFDLDANAAYQNAVMWAISGEPAYAEKAREIVDGWVATLQRVGGADAVLLGSLGPFKLVNAAEILRYTGAGWPEEDARRFERLCREVFYPVLKDFAPFANGNWDTAAVKTVMAMGVFAEDRAMYERALRYYVDGAGDGRLTNYIYAGGQCQESGRDQGHTQLGLAHLGDAAEIAWHQGLDLYSYAGNRLLAGFEYTAKYNLGEEVPFEPDLDRTGKYAHAVISPRGPLRPVFEQIYNHYVNRQGTAAPYSQKAAEKLRPEAAAQGADHPGFGTLFYTRGKGSDEAVPAVPPGGLVAQSSAFGIRLTWVGTRAGGGYTVKRGTSPGGPYTAIATNLRAAEFVDAKAKRGTVYYYVVSASNADSLETGMAAGLPAPWLADGPGSAMFDGSVFTLEAADRVQLAYRPFQGDGAITARFVPQVSAQSSRMGVAMRAGPAADGPQVALLLAPSFSSADRERPDWHASMVQDDREIGVSPSLGAPYVAWGRLMQPYWLKLERSGNRFTGFTSADGESWTKVAETTAELPSRSFAGLAASSSQAKVTTTVRFDHVSLGAK